VLVGLEGLALGGCPINALDLAAALRERGHRVNVFAIDEVVKVSLLPYAEQAGFTPTLLPARAGLLSRARQIRRLAAEHAADVVHVYAPWLGPAASTAVAASRGQAAVVTNWTMANDVRTATHTPLIVGTRLLQRDAESSHRSPVWLMEPPVDLAKDRPDPAAGKAFRARHEIADDDVCAVIVSRLDRVMKAEGIAYAMQAVAGLADRGMRLVVVGDGDAYEDLRALGEKLNADAGRRAVVLTGPMRDPRPAYAGADVVLGMGGSALRALAHAKPLVVVGVNGFARTFRPASVDYFYDAGFYGEAPLADPVTQLGEQLAELLDPETRRVLADFGLSEVSRRFSLGGAAARLEHIYLEALTKSPRRVVHIADSAYLLSRHAGQRTVRFLSSRVQRGAAARGRSSS
jgi:glycosyltransferase involved in cell wall biosynthesis